MHHYNIILWCWKNKTNVCNEDLASCYTLHLIRQGGLAGKGSPVPLTAYVLISLLEAGTPINTPVVMDTGRCVLSDSSRDPYTIALKAYALALAKHEGAQQLLLQLLNMAVEEKNAIYWNLSRGPCKSCY